MRTANWAHGAIPRGDPVHAPSGASAASSAQTTMLNAVPTLTPGFSPGQSSHAANTAFRAQQGAAKPLPALARWLKQQWLPALLGMVSISSVLVFWHLATLYKLDFYVRFNNIPAPMEVFNKLVEVNQSPQFLTNIGISVRRILLGFLVAAVLGVGMGLMIGRYKIVRMLSLPALEVLRPVPAIAWVPMSIMLWPDNEVSIVFITFLGAYFPILLNTIHGVESIDPVLLRAARCLGCPERRMLWQIMLPAAMPHIFTGLAVGMGVAWVSLIAAEMISGQFGIGYFTWEAYSLISYAEIVLGMITIGVLGLLCSGGIQLAARLVMPWRTNSQKGGA